METQMRAAAMLGYILPIGMALAPLPARAAVTYTFEALSSFPATGAPAGITGGFSFTVDSFLTTSQDIDRSQLSSCSVVPDTFRCFSYQTVGDVEPGGSDYVQFQLVSPDSRRFGPIYYFDDGAFQQVGVHDTILFGASQAGRLTVSTGGPAMPEPGTWATMMLGFAATGLLLRRRRLRDDRGAWWVRRLPLQSARMAE